MDQAQDTSTSSPRRQDSEGQAVQDTYSAVWVSHTSIQDFLSCPRAYYIKNIYKDPTSGRKIKLMAPPLALGQAVHEVLDEISLLPKETRFTKSLIDRLDVAWEKIAGEKGGFTSTSQEEQFKKRARSMLERVTKHKGPLAGLAVKIKMDLPHFWLSEKDQIILCGKLDWLEYTPDRDSVSIIDFKTGVNEEATDSLQLPIYFLLAQNCQPRTVERASYWYLDRNDEPQEQPLPDAKQAMDSVYKIAKEIKLAKSLKRFKCRYGECRNCKPLEKVLKNQATYVGIDEYGRDMYILPDSNNNTDQKSVIL